MKRIIFLCGIIFSLILAGCQPSVKSHVEGEGPLSVRVGGGGLSMKFENDDAPWQGTAGAFMPCVAKGKKELEITKIGYVEHNLAKPVNVKVIKRVVVGMDAQDPIGASRGVPPNLEGGYLSGDISEDVVGTMVTESCDGPVDYSNFTEFLFVIESDEAGMHIEEVFFEYKVGGRLYVLEVPREIVFCGEATKDHRLCSGYE